MTRHRFGRMQDAFSTCTVKTIPLLRTLIEKESELALKSVSSVPLGGISGRKLARVSCSTTLAHAETQNCPRDTPFPGVGAIHHTFMPLRRSGSARHTDSQRVLRDGNLTS